MVIKQTKGTSNERNWSIKFTQKWRVGVYLRLSKEDEISGTSASIENQRDIINEFIDGKPLDFVLAETYIDDGISGATSERPAFKHLIEDVKSSFINCVMVKDTSRFARNVADADYYVGTVFPQYGVRFIALGSPIVDSFEDPESVDGMQFHFENYFNEYFLKSTSKKVRKVLETKRRKGEFVAPFAPYGYRKDPENKHKLLVDDEAAEIVRKIFHLFVYENLSLRAIAIRLNNMAVPTMGQHKRLNGVNHHPGKLPRIPAWGYVAVKKIIMDYRYCGHLVQGMQKRISYKVKKVVDVPKEDWIIVKHTHEAIIDEEIFQKAQTLAQRPSRVSKATNEKSNYSGLLFCGKCGYTLNRKRDTNGTFAYRCKLHSNIKMCEPLHIKEKLLDEKVLYAIKSQIMFVVEMDSIKQKIVGSNNFEADSQILKANLATLEKEKERLENKNHRLYDDYSEGIIDRELYISRSSLLQEELAINREKIGKIRLEMKQFKKVQLSTNEYVENFKKFETVNEINRELLVDLVDKIFVENAGTNEKGKKIKKVTVVFNFEDEAKALTGFVEENKFVAI